jgi:hypothetical protein
VSVLDPLEQTVRVSTPQLLGLEGGRVLTCVFEVVFASAMSSATKVKGKYETYRLLKGVKDNVPQRVYVALRQRHNRQRALEGSRGCDVGCCTLHGDGSIAGV